MKTLFIYFCKLLVFPIISLFTKEIKGKENIPQENTFIIASNHINSLDYWFIGNALQERLRILRFVGAMDNLKILLQSGLLYYAAETITINRQKEGREKINKKMIENLENEKVIVIFPEGNVNREKELLRGKTGVAELALKAEVPIIPLGMRKEKNSFKRIIEIGKPLYFLKERVLLNQIKNNQEEYHSLLRKTTNKIMQNISKLSQKPYPYDN